MKILDKENIPLEATGKAGKVAMKENSCIDTAPLIVSPCSSLVVSPTLSLKHFDGDDLISLTGTVTVTAEEEEEEEKSHEEEAKSSVTTNVINESSLHNERKLSRSHLSSFLSYSTDIDEDVDEDVDENEDENENENEDVVVDKDESKREDYRDESQETQLSRLQKTFSILYPTVNASFSMANEILKQIEFKPTCRPNPLSSLIEPQTVVRVVGRGYENVYRCDENNLERQDKMRVLALNEKNRLGFRHNFWGFVFEDKKSSTNLSEPCISILTSSSSSSGSTSLVGKHQDSSNKKNCLLVPKMGNSGFNVLLMNNINGRRMCEAVAKRLYERSEAEKAFGKKLCSIGGNSYSLNSGPSSHDKKSSVSSSVSNSDDLNVFTGVGVTMRPLIIHGLFKDPEIEGKGRIAFATAIKDELIPVITCFVQEQQIHCQMIEDRMRKSCKRLEDSIRRADKFYSNYKDAVRAFIRNFGVSCGDRDRGRGHVFRSTRKLMAAEREMNQCAEDYNQARDNWELEMFDCMQIFENEEKERLRMLKSVMQSYSCYYKDFVSRPMQESHAMLSDLGDSADYLRDIEYFVREHGTGCVIPLRRTFETFSISDYIEIVD